MRDLQWRSRRFALGALATALVFAVTLLLTGLNSAFINESNQTVAAFRADRWIVPAGVSGPFTQDVPLSAAQVSEAAHLPGVVRATPIVALPIGVDERGQVHAANLFGYPAHGGFLPKITAGRAPRTASEVAVDPLLGVPIGSSIGIKGRRWRVVGWVSGLTYDAGTPAVLMLLSAARGIAFGGGAQASTVITRGVPRGTPPAGLRVLTNAAVVADLRRPLDSATSAIEIVAILLLLVATGVVGLMVYLSSLDRRMEFAVYKAIGVSSRRLLASLVLQTVLLALAAAVLAVAASAALASSFPIPVTIGSGAYATLFGAALVVGLASSVVGVRQTNRVDPAAAFGGRGT